MAGSWRGLRDYRDGTVLLGGRLSHELGADVLTVIDGCWKDVWLYFAAVRAPLSPT
jgi:hypothetical protein